jgi:hypothetical protein
MTVILYPREFVCEICGIVMFLSWEQPFGRGSNRAIYQHPKFVGCELNGEKLSPTGIMAGVIEEEK